MKTLQYILLSCLFLIYISEPAYAFSIPTSSEMACCIDMEDKQAQGMDCCDMSMEDMENCVMDSCGCPMANSISLVFTSNPQKDLNLIDGFHAQVYASLTPAVQSAFLSIWTPPDIA